MIRKTIDWLVLVAVAVVIGCALAWAF